MKVDGILNALINPILARYLLCAVPGHLSSAVLSRHQGYNDRQGDVGGTAIGIIGFEGLCDPFVATVGRYLIELDLVSVFVQYLFYGLSLRNAIVAFQMGVDQDGLILEGIQDPVGVVHIGA